MPPLVASIGKSGKCVQQHPDTPLHFNYFRPLLELLTHPPFTINANIIILLWSHGTLHIKTHISHAKTMLLNGMGYVLSVPKKHEGSVVYWQMWTPRPSKSEESHYLIC